MIHKEIDGFSFGANDVGIEITCGEKSVVLGRNAYLMRNDGFLMRADQITQQVRLFGDKEITQIRVIGDCWMMFNPEHKLTEVDGFKLALWHRDIDNKGQEEIKSNE